MAAKLAGLICFTVTLLGLATSVAAQKPRLDAKSAIIADVELVELPVIVLDPKGAVVSGLQKSDFRIFEDKVEQRVLYCDRDRQSVSFVMLGDISQSMTRKIPFVQEAAAAVMDFLPAATRSRDEYSLFGVESRVHRLFVFSDDDRDLERQLPTLLTPTKGSTALFDGIYDGVLAAEREAKNERRAVIVISDGGDNHSRHNLRQTRRFLEEAGVPVFAVMAGPRFETAVLPQDKLQIRNLPIPIPAPGPNYVGPTERAGPGNLKNLTQVTGGSVFTAHDPGALTRIARTLSDAVRYEYVLSYQSQGTEGLKHKDNWHEVRLELAPKEKFKGYTIYYKRGYFKAPAPAR
jgi:Ca-activated chloride channel homolog